MLGGDFTDRQSVMRVTAIACALGCGLVALDLWANRDLFDPDGISYLDIADAYRRADWRAALVGLWSPAYSWLLALMVILFNPSPRWEFTAVHALNFFVYLLTLAAFTVFTRAFLRAHKETAPNRGIPDWAWVVFGYALFFWSIIRLVPTYLPEPDLILCALVYLIFALLFRIRTQSIGWPEAICFGALLGFGYLTKAVMFPMGFVFTAVALALAWRSKQRCKVLAAFLVFLLLSAPYIVALSNVKERWLFSDAGLLNYAWDINHVRWHHWQGEDSLHGTPVHPTRQIHNDPPMYEFATPFIHATYPPWYDPSYWFDGLKVKWDLQKQLPVIFRNTERLLFLLASSPGAASNWLGHSELTGNDRTIGALLTLFCVVVLMHRKPAALFRGLAKHCFVFIPIGAVLLAYGILHFEGRYIAAYMVILWMVLFRSLAVAYADESGRIFTAVLASAALITALTLIVGTAQATFYAAQYFAGGNSQAPLLQSGYTDWKIAEYLHNAGLHEGDSVGAVGWAFSAYWARMARLRIIAEIPREGAKAFWSSDTTKRAVIMRSFQNVGAKAVVATGVPKDLAPINWERIGDTDHYVYVFQKAR